MEFNLNDGEEFIQNFKELVESKGFFVAEDPTLVESDFYAFYYAKDFKSLKQFIDDIRQDLENSFEVSENRSQDIYWIGTDHKYVDEDPENLKKIFNQLGYTSVTITKNKLIANP